MDPGFLDEARRAHGGRESIVDVTGRFVLARDVVLVDAETVDGPRSPGPPGPSGAVDPTGLADLADAMCAMTVVTDHTTLRLIDRFQVPTRISDAIWVVARETGHHPEDVLDQCYPAIRGLIEAGYIVSEGSCRARVLVEANPASKGTGAGGSTDG